MVELVLIIMFRLSCGRRYFLFNSRDWTGRCPNWRPSVRSCSRKSGSESESGCGHGSAVTGKSNWGQLEYEGNLTRVVKGVKLFSLSTSSLGLAIQSILYLKMSGSETHNWVFVFAGSIATIVLMSPLLLHYITKRYVTHLYYEPESRTFTTCSLTLFNRKRVTTFKAEDVAIPLVRGPFTTYTVSRKPFFIDPLAFKDISVFEHLVGYDKLDERLRGRVGDEDQTANPASGDADAQETHSPSDNRNKSN